MIVLPCAAGTVVVFTAVWFVWQARRVWLYGQPEPLRASVTVVVARACQSPSEIPESQRRAETAGGSAVLEGVRVIRGEVECGSLSPSQPIGADAVGRDDGSGLAAGDRAAARSGLDAAGRPRRITPRPGAEYPQITACGGDWQDWQR